MQVSKPALEMRIFQILLTCCLVSSVSGQTHSKPQKESLPDVFLITIDTLRADHVHCYGYDLIQTPTLDGLAKDGIRFAEAFTPSPITNSSHISILTGLLPSTHGVTDFAVPISPEHPTLAELLKERGYSTAAFIGAVILDSNTLAPGLDRGFDYYDNFPQHPRTHARWGRVERRASDVVQRAETWLTAHNSGPHFVWLHMYDPHDPYEPPPPYSEIYRDRLYDGEIAYADSALANFVAYLKRHARYDNSIVVVVGDHGEGLGDHNENTHGLFLYDSTLHVPLLIKLPQQIGAGKVVTSQVRTTDIFPTVLNLLNAPLPDRLDGESLKPYFGDSRKTDLPAFAETDYPLRFGWSPLRAVRTEGFKFIEAPRPELYDLVRDPKELENRYDPSSAQVKQFSAVLDGRYAKAPATPSSKANVDQPTIDASNTSRDALPDPKDKIEEQNLLHTAMMAADDNRPSEAIAALQKVLLLDPNSATALRQIGEMELKAEAYAEAASHLHRALQVRPNDAAAAFYEGEALEKLGDTAGARAALEASLKLSPEQFPARLLLGQIYLTLKDLNAAEDQLEAALLLDPGSLKAKLSLAQTLILERDLERAVQELEELSSTNSDDAEVFDLLGEAYSGLGKRELAAKSQARAAALRLKK